MTVVGILVTALLSGIMAAMCTFYLNEGKERWQLRREKIEEIYLGLEEWSSGLVIHFASHYSILKGEMTFDQLNQLTIERGAPGKDRITSLQMNVYMYHPDLSEPLEILMKLRDRLASIASEIKRDYKDGTLSPNKYGRLLRQNLDAYNLAHREFEKRIIAKGREIAFESSQASALLGAVVAPARGGWQRLKKRAREMRPSAAPSDQKPSA